MPDPASATDGVFADGWEPLGDGRAPSSRWASSSAANGAPASNGEAVPANGSRS
jgi:hypothetical protein